jgi:hypothetical protein
LELGNGTQASACSASALSLSYSPGSCLGSYVQAKGRREMRSGYCHVLSNFLGGRSPCWLLGIQWTSQSRCDIMENHPGIPTDFLSINPRATCSHPRPLSCRCSLWGHPPCSLSLIKSFICHGTPFQKAWLDIMTFWEFFKIPLALNR